MAGLNQFDNAIITKEAVITYLTGHKGVCPLLYGLFSQESSCSTAYGHTTYLVAKFTVMPYACYPKLILDKCKQLLF